MSEQLNRLLLDLERRLRQRLANLFRRGEIALANAAGYVQIEGYEGDPFDDVPLWGPFGFTSRPPAGTEVLTAHLMGRSEEAIAVACDSEAHRPDDLAEGEVVAYGLKSVPGQAQARLKADGSLDLNCATGKTVNIGGDTDAIILGTTFKSACGGLTPATGPTDVVTAVNAVIAALKAMPLATKAKVS